MGIPSKQQLATLQSTHARRKHRIRHAWVQASEGSADGAAAARRAWQLLGPLDAAAVDCGDFGDLLEHDLAQHGAPGEWLAFASQYNRLTKARALLFHRTYTMGELLGQGGFGQVIQASHASGARFSLKYANKEKLSDRNTLLLESEAAVWRRVHAGSGSGGQTIARLHDCYELPSAIILVTELCEGQCLLDRLCDVDHFTEAHAQAISEQVSKAVVHLHGLGIAHRDIKPENVLCTDPEPHRSGHIKLADFGLAADYSGAAQDDAFFTRLIGTPEYLAPEMVDALMAARAKLPTQKGYNERVDYWALGCLIYELFAGEPPYLSDDDEAQYALIQRADLRFPDESFGAVSEAAKALMRGLLDPEPKTRFTSVELAANEWIKARAAHAPILLSRQDSARKAMVLRKNRRLRNIVHMTEAAVRMDKSSRVRRFSEERGLDSLGEVEVEYSFGKEVSCSPKRLDQEPCKDSCTSVLSAAGVVDCLRKEDATA